MFRFFSLGRASGRVCAALLAAVALLAHAGGDAPSGLKNAWQAAEKAAQVGPATIKLRDQATLQLRVDEAFIPQPQADRLMDAMGNGADPAMIGLVVSTRDDASWMVVVSYEDSGYVRDDDAKDNWKASEMFDSLKEGTGEQNKERAKRGMAELELTGWVETPRYDAATHHLVWSLAAREKGQPAGSSAPQTINYNTYALGRQGYISLNLLTDSASVDADKPAVHALLNQLQFNAGKRYADFDSSTDKVAKYGLAALVVGVAAKKLGLIALLAAVFAKFAKVIVVTVMAVLYGVRKFFTGKGKPAPAPAPVNAPSPPPHESSGPPGDWPGGRA